MINVGQANGEFVGEGRLPACFLDEFDAGVGLRDGDAMADATVLGGRRGGGKCEQAGKGEAKHEGLSFGYI